MSKTTPAALARRDRDRRALRLRSQGMPWAHVAQACGYTDDHHALIAVQRLMRRETHNDVELARAIHRERLELLMRSLWPAATNPGMAQQAAREAHQPPPPSQVSAIAQLLRLLSDLADVEGTKAPVRARLSGGCRRL